MQILVINSGSSSLKVGLFEAKKELKLVSEALVDGINLRKCRLVTKTEKKVKVKNHEEALKLVLTELEIKKVDAVGHRVVHGGEHYQQATKIDRKVLKTIEKLSKLAPLHNPINLESIKACQKLLKRTKHFAIFDTAFHQSMPEKAYLYPLPYKYYKKDNIRRYGFHGSSHKYVVNEVLKKIRNKKAKIISCHLGNGASITASANGKSIDTSMGFTPLEGIIMGTRSGSIDPAIILYLERKYKLKADKIDEILNHKSGLLGVSEISSDMREIYQKSLKKNKRAQLTIDILSYQIAKYCGAYAAAMQGLDAIIFTGGLGEKAFYVREQVAEYLSFLGLNIDKKKNSKITPPNKHKDFEAIHKSNSKIKAYVIATDEEKQIALEVKKLI